MRLRSPQFTLALAFGITIAGAVAGCTQGAIAPPVATGPTQPAPGQPNAPIAGDTGEGNLLLGNPTGAAKDPDNFLLERPQYTLSYNRSRGGANWVAWHIDQQDLGKEERGKFRPDPDLPAEWQIGPNDYRNSGYDRGHVCPSGDRTGSREDNDATFYMSNMLPQTAELNRAVWADFENALRDIVREGNEVYVIAGGSGKLKGDAGTIAEGKVTVPQICWKVALILPAGTNDLKRIDAQTRVITVAMPNVAEQKLKDGDWRQYIVSTKKLSDAINKDAPLQLDFFAALPKDVQTALEAKKDKEAI